MSLRREKVGKTVARLAAKINIIACFGRSDERCRTFSENFRRCLKIAEDCRRLARKTRRSYDHTPTNLSTNCEIIDIFTSKRVGKGFFVNRECLFLIAVNRERTKLFPVIRDRKYSRDS